MGRVISHGPFNSLPFSSKVSLYTKRRRSDEASDHQHDLLSGSCTERYPCCQGSLDCCGSHLELRQVNRPASLTDCADDAFVGTPFTGLTIDSGTVQLSADGKTLLRYPAGQTAHRYQVPAGVTRIADNAFEGADQLYWVDLLDGLMDIGVHAFRDCTRLSAIYLPNSVHTVGEGAFRDCSSLTILNLSPNLTTISYQMCDDCDNLTSVILPEGVQIISPNAFADCEQLKQLLLPDSLCEMQGQVFESSLQLDTVIFRSGNVKLDEEALFTLPGTDGEFGSLGYPIDGLTIYAPAGTAVETYAQNNHIIFRALPNHIGLDNIKKVLDYTGFSDVDESAWYGVRQTGVIKSVYMLGIMEGTGNNCFQPNDAITRAEAIKIAAVVHDLYQGGTGKLAAGNTPWYHDFLNYALANEIIYPMIFRSMTSRRHRQKWLRYLLLACRKQNSCRWHGR